MLNEPTYPPLLSELNQAWLDAFSAAYARAPRVLMIGNIANNAYNNAKILNQAGLDCDVLCYDYYHMMGCPEWEDADPIESPANDFRPDWTRVKGITYERPRWFSQGPMLDAIKYLISRRSNMPDQEKRWRRLAITAFALRPVGFEERFLVVWLRLKNWSQPYRTQPQTWVRSALHRWIGRVRRLLRPQPAVTTRSHDNRDVTGNTAPSEKNPSLLPILFAREFPDRADKLTEVDIAPYQSYHAEWEQLMSLYDIVIGFSTDPFWPLLHGKPYFAIEHGTLRDIPFAPDPQGRRTALAYRLARHCFVTNFDCADNAFLLAPGRHTLINHPYDEDHGLSITGAGQVRTRLLHLLDAEFLFFHPTRQDWVEGTGYADKNNDVFIRAFATMRKCGLKVGAVMCSWGANVQHSKDLLAELDCSEHVHWIAPLAITPFERMCMACDTVVDQFKLGAFGGVMFKAMAVGTPIITYLNMELIAHHYSEMPPVINCKTVEDIETATVELMRKPVKLRLLGEQSREWICRHHGKRDTINKQVDQFRNHLPVPTCDMATTTL